MRSSNRWQAAVAAAGLLLAGCASVQPVAIPLGDHRLPPKRSDATVLVFRDEAPTRPHTPVARLNVHIEKTFFVRSAFADAWPQLEALARQSGADAIMQIEEKSSRLNETFIYNVSATAIVFDD